ncbi:DNA-binding protein [Desulfuribacillus stibiiarsenatis]|uniref:DNA-binding protein n=1 Tax=Desulfuribacillus stibiiarsenatis TaxID=1390249 RepID=A0A1E5L2J7_9FIRM|nr:HU family DNA-binding protein [Desulfuribacillus stibiiarsenatis]OEH84346.1 DNA-binding protein [Desulfuribacillus stibiiarsenatis]
MNKVELVNQMVESTGLKKKDVEAALNSFIETVGDALAKGDKVQLIGFGTFETRERAARSGRNPQTGATITIPAAKVPAFKAGAKLKEAVK